MRAARSIGEMFTFGGRVPPTVGGLISAIVVASLVGALGRGFGFLEEAALVPIAVWQGQVWRLVTWVFFEQRDEARARGGEAAQEVAARWSWDQAAARILSRIEQLGT